MNLEEAVKLWKIRLSNNCRDRIASGCKNDFSTTEQCNILVCPRLVREAHIKKIFIFRDLKGDGS